MNLPTPRPDQERTIDGISAEFRNGNRWVICQAPTRSGKTVIACLMMARAKARGKRCLFVAQSRQIVTQTMDALSEYEIPHGVLMDGYPVALYEDIQVGSIQSILSWCDREEGGLSWPQADVIFPDECHSESYWRLHAQYPSAYFVGLSATPCDSKGRGLGRRMRRVFKRDIDTGVETDLGEYAAGYDAIVVGATYAEMLQVGQIVPLRIYSQHRTDVPAIAGEDDAIELQKRAALYMEDSRLVGEAVKTWLELAQGRKTLYFAQSVAHSIMLRDGFLAAGIPAEHVDGNSPDALRDQIRSRSRSGETRIVTNCNTLHTGTNWNWISCVGVARLVSSFPLWRQMPARGAGKWEGKEDCIILDHGGVAHVFGSPDIDVVWPLDPKRSAEKEFLRQRNGEVGRKGDPGPCVKCGLWLDFGRVCGRCGAQRPGKTFHHEDGKLVELGLGFEGEGAPSRPQKSKEQKLWDSMLWSAAMRGQTIYQAAGRFRKETNQWPGSVKGLVNVPAQQHEWKMPVQDVFPEIGRKRRGKGKASVGESA